MGVLTPLIARRIIDSLGGSGNPPEVGLEHFTVGLDPILKPLTDEYIATSIKQGGSSFKLVVGNYGDGKTHLLRCVRNLAWEHNYVVAYVEIRGQSTPFHELHKIFFEIANSIMSSVSDDELLSDYERGLGSFIRREYVKLSDQLLEEHRESEVQSQLNRDLAGNLRTDSISFNNGIKKLFEFVNMDDEFNKVLQWFTGEMNPDRLLRSWGVSEKIDRSTGFKMIRSLAQMVRCFGYSGLVVLFDEAESSSSLSSKQKEALLSNLRSVIDACVLSSFQRVLMLYAVPNTAFMDEGRGSYQALQQRLATSFSRLNPSGAQIRLEDLMPESLLPDVGRRLAEVYEVAHNIQLDPLSRDQHISESIKETTSKKFAGDGLKRTFVRDIVGRYHKMRIEGE